MALSREQVVRAAVALLDEVGLEGLTLRRLASELGVQAPTLYWHVRDKRHLLDLMAEEIVRETAPRDLSEPAPGQPWWDWLEERTRLSFEALLRHRDAALVVAGNRPTDDSLPGAERAVGALVTVGFPPQEALGTILMLGHYVIGCVVEYQAEAARAGRTEEREALARRMRESDDLPMLTAAVSTMGGPGSSGSFQHGLRLLVAGLRVRHAELVGEDRTVTV